MDSHTLTCGGIAAIASAAVASSSGVIIGSWCMSALLASRHSTLTLPGCRHPADTPILAALKRGALRQAHQSELGRGIGGGAHARHLRRYAADVDDPPAALALHDLHRLAGAQEDRRQVNVDHILPVLQSDLVYGAALEYPRIVDEQVDPSELLHRLPEQLQHLPLVRQVRLHHEHLRPEAPKLLGGRLQVVPVPGRGGQIGPIPSECSRDPLPDPGARPRNDSYLPFKLSHISSLRGLASTPYL